MRIRGVSRRAALGLATLGFTAALVGVAGPAPAHAAAGSYQLTAGQGLAGNQWIRSPNGQFTALMQTDGNFVLYGPHGALWSTRTGGSSGGSLSMQADGNLVLYRNGAAIWLSGTAGYSDVSLVLQDDGNLVLYRGGTPLWARSWHSTWGTTRSDNGSAWGYCSWYAYERFKQFTGVYPHVGSSNAYTWNEAAAARGWQVLNQPVTQAVVVFERGVQGASTVTGHVAWVEFMRPRADGGTDVLIAEMNGVAGFGVVGTRWVRHVAGMTYLMAPQL
jgi:surface antigen